MSEVPSPLLLAMARAVLVAAGEVVMSQDLVDAIADVNARRRAGEPVSQAEVDWIEAELKLSPGYAEWVSCQLLNAALNPRSPENVQS